MMNALMVNSGIIYALVLYAIFPMDKIIIMSALPSILFLLTSFFLPESPMWLMKKGKVDEAKVMNAGYYLYYNLSTWVCLQKKNWIYFCQKSLINLRGPKYDFNPELKELEYLVKSKNTGVMETMKELRSRTNVIPFIIMATMIIFQVRTI